MAVKDTDVFWGEREDSGVKRGGGAKKRGCECPQGERDREHPSLLQMFCKPQLQLHAPITFLRLASTTHTITHTHSHFLLAIHQELTLKINSIMYHTSPLLRTSSLTHITAHISGQPACRHTVYTAHVHAKKDIKCLF